MRKILLVLFFCLIFAASAFAESAKLAWEKSPSADVAGYRFYLKEQGATAKQKIGEVTVGTTHPTTATTSAFTVEGAKSYVIVATAFDAKGNESAESNAAINSVTKEVVVFTDTTAPQPPGTLQIQERIAQALEDLVRIAQNGIAIKQIQ